MKHLTHKIGCITQLSPHEVTLTRHTSGAFHLRTVHYIGGHPFIIDVAYESAVAELADLEVTFHQLKNPISKQGLSEERLQLCCEQLNRYLLSLNASTQTQKQFMAIFTQFTGLYAYENTSRDGGYELFAKEATQEFRLKTSNTDAPYVFTVAQTDTVYPIGVSLPNGKHCIVNTQDSLLRVLDAR